MEDFTIVILASILLKNVTDKNRSNAHKNLPVLIETGKGTFAVGCAVSNIIGRNNRAITSFHCK